MLKVLFSFREDLNEKADHCKLGVPVDDKQFFQVLCAQFSILQTFNETYGIDFSWTKPQVQARSHPNLLAAIVWLNNLYHAQVPDAGKSEKNEQLANTMKGVDLSTPLTYADRFRIRKPGAHWNFDFNPPHVDGACSYFWEL